jgi:hypothetical protein
MRAIASDERADASHRPAHPDHRRRTGRVQPADRRGPLTRRRLPSRRTHQGHPPAVPRPARVAVRNQPRAGHRRPRRLARLPTVQPPDHQLRLTASRGPTHTVLRAGSVVGEIPSALADLDLPGGASNRCTRSHAPTRGKTRRLPVSEGGARLREFRTRNGGGRGRLHPTWRSVLQFLPAGVSQAADAKEHEA